jgi:anti-anti-sigma factor
MRTSEGVTVVDVITGKVATNQDIQRVTQAFLARGNPPRIILNLTGVQLVSSSFIAGLIALNRRLNDAQGKLVLCDLSPIVRETLAGAKLDRILTVCDTETDAQRFFLSPPAA